MNTRCKLRCTERVVHDTQETIKFTAVYSNDDNSENKVFCQFTPHAVFEFTITNQALFGKYTPGEEYYFDISLAPTPVPVETEEDDGELDDEL